ncbi:type VII secretion target [Streptomyces sp. NPDC004129]|uniref:type VII secretion target n=1 Tax=Streptomyces sp. NPDC004533 TaxID=3154278 RepID=UPI0033ACD260
MSDPILKVVTDALRTDARMWDRESERMGNIHRTVEGLRLSRIQAGVFQVLFSAYEDAIDQISARCAEGQHRMDEVATALIKNANAYDSREADVKQSIDGAY